MTDQPTSPSVSPRPSSFENTPPNNPSVANPNNPNNPQFAPNTPDNLAVSGGPGRLGDKSPNNPQVPKVNHLHGIAELVRSLHGASPSAAETISAQLLDHVDALHDPKAYDARIAAQNKVEVDAEAARAKVRADAKRGRSGYSPV
jgi:hypothetical protein